MCLMAYVAADKPLRAIAVRDSFGLGLSVESVDARHPVRRTLAKEHVYVVGTPTCACALIADDADAEDTTRLLEELRSYLDEAVGTADAIEFLACWIGDEEGTASHAVLTPEEVGTIDFDSAADRPFRATITT